MNELLGNLDIVGIITSIFELVLIPIATWAAAEVREWAKAKKIDKYTDMLFEAVGNAVKEIYQTIVVDIKGTEEWTDEKKKEMLELAKTKATLSLSTSAYKILQEAHEDFDMWLETMIEAKLYDLEILTDLRPGDAIMEDNIIIETISAIPFGVILNWIVGFCAIVAAVSAIAVRLYKVFEKYKNSKDQNTKLKEEVKNHNERFKKIEEDIEELHGKIDRVQQTLEQQNTRELNKLRHSICREAEEAIEKGRISIQSLRSLEDMYDDYKNTFHKNGYVKDLMNTVRTSVETIGSIEEEKE